MPRGSGVSNPPEAAGSAAVATASSKNVSRNAGHSGPSCSSPAYQFRPVTRSMTRGSDNVASHGFKAGGSACSSTRRIISDACFSIQLAASRPTTTHARSPLKVTTSGWKPLSQPVALNEEKKCASLTINPTAKRSRIASSQAVKDSKANSSVPNGKKYRDEDNVSLCDQLDGAIMPSPTKKLQTCKGPSDAPSVRKSTIRILGVKGVALPPTGKSQVETGKGFATAPAEVFSGKDYTNAPAEVVSGKGLANAPAEVVSGKGLANAPVEVVSASTNKIIQSDNAAVPLHAHQLQPDTAKNYSVAMHTHETKVNQLAATFATWPRVNLQTDYNKKPSNVPIMANQASGLAGATIPLITPKLEIGNMKDNSNPLSNAAYTRALLIKQQEQLLEQYKSLGSQQWQQHEQQLYIKGPALFENDDPPPVEPLGTRCQLCKLDIAFRPQGDPGHDANAPPVVAVLACHHVFHSKCIESVYGLAEPAECLACLEPGAAH